jgi:two-component system alkaline phosphatase synthesis response regulator PhoP
MDETAAVLVVEDDRNITDLITLHLSEAGYTVDAVRDGSEGSRKATSSDYDLVILDLMLPGIDGLSICRRLREQENYTPILMVTARSEEMDKVLGLELGADDYLTKPFSPRELVARVKALLRRAREMDGRGAGETKRIEVGDLVMDTTRRRVFLRDQEVELTAKEYELLTFLAASPGQAFNRDQLLDRVWHYQHGGYSHTVNSHINRLRAKIEVDPSDPKYILTVWGYGYRFVELDELRPSEEPGKVES